MTKEVTLRQAGGFVSATLPKDMLDRLHLEAGDRLFAMETDGGILLSPHDVGIQIELDEVSRAARKLRGPLRELTK